MTTSPPPSADPPPPDKAAAAGAAPDRPRRKGANPNRVTLQIDPKAAMIRVLSWTERLRRDLISGGYGFGVSLAVHAVLAFLALLITFKAYQRHEGDPLIMTIMSSKAAGKGGEAQVRKELDLANVTLPNPATTPQPTEPTMPQPAGDTEKSVGPVGVKPVDVGGALQQRSPRGRTGDQLERLGGTASSEQAIKAGLAWLAKHQKSDGRWELHQGYPDHGMPVIRTDTGATALALLCFLGAGHTHQSGDHTVTVDKGLRWLLSVQSPEGDLHDQRQEEGRQTAFYAHSMATMVLCEALAITGDNSLRPAAQKAVTYLLAAQHPTTGGWKYRPISKLMVGDLSVTGWALMALHTARAAGITVDPEEFERAALFLNSLQENHGARYKYEPTSPPGKTTVALTAEGLLCRQWLGWPRQHPPLQDGVKFLMADENRPEWTSGKRNVYAWYYMSQCLHNMGGEPWRKWNGQVREIVVKNQVATGSVTDVRGSWHPHRPVGMGEEYSEKGGRLYITALCLLILETPYRHSPIYAAE